MTVVLDDFARLKTEAESLTKEHYKAIGGKTAAKKELRKKYGVKTMAQARLKLRRLEKEAAATAKVYFETKAKYEKELKAYKEKQ